MPRKTKTDIPLTNNDIKSPQEDNTPTTADIKKEHSPKHHKAIVGSKLNDKQKDQLTSHAHSMSAKHMKRMIELMRDHKATFKVAHSIATKEHGANKKDIK